MSYSALLQQAASNATSELKFNSRRSPVYGTRGMVSCSQPLAAEAGLRLLQAGGNAADAAVAVAAALGVTEPCSTGAGGDAFGLFYSAKTRKVSCLQGNGAAPAALTLEAVAAAGITSQLPTRSALCATVPGAVAFWEDAVKHWGSGTKTLAEILAPAIELAEQGFPVSPVTAFDWARGASIIVEAGGEGIRALVDEQGLGPKPGQLWRNPDLAATYRSIAEHGAAKGFYSGRIAEAIVAALRERGGVMSLQDLADHRAVACEPMCTTYRGHVVWEVPPPTAGIVTLMALNLLTAHQQQQQQQQQQQEHQGPQQDPQQQQQQQQQRGSSGGWSADQLHLAVESCRLAFADALAQVADPVVHRELPVEALLSQDRAAQRYKQFFDPGQACHPVPCEQLESVGPPREEQGADTCQWVVVDGEGNAASFIQSNYMGFGLGIVPTGCGFSLQNRGHGFTLQPGHPNTLAPGKRPYHTIMPGMLTDTQGRLVAAFGCMGGYMQPQGHLQLLLQVLVSGADPQAALDAPRFCIDRLDSSVGPASVQDSYLLLEDGIEAAVVAALRAKGHHVSICSSFARSVFGKGTIITRDKDSGVLTGGVDPRGDGAVMGW